MSPPVASAPPHDASQRSSHEVDGWSGSDPARKRRSALLLALGALAAILGAVAGASMLAPSRPSDLPRTDPVREPLPPASVRAPFTPDPLKFQSLAPDDAFRANAAIPDSRVPDQPAEPFVLAGVDSSGRARDVTCLADAVYYEAASESLDGQQAVAQVVLNRMHDPRFPATVCGVVFQGAGRVTGCQFSFTCDGSLRRAPAPTAWRRARAVAEAALDGYVMTAIGHATHYHTVWVTPYWSPSLVKWGRIGSHIFYRWAGGNDARAPAAAELVPSPPSLLANGVAWKAKPSSSEGTPEASADAVQEEPFRPPPLTADVAKADSHPAAPAPSAQVVPAPYGIARHNPVLDSPGFASREQGGPSL